MAQRLILGEVPKISRQSFACKQICCALVDHVVNVLRKVHPTVEGYTKVFVLCPVVCDFQPLLDHVTDNFCIFVWIITMSSV